MSETKIVSNRLSDTGEFTFSELALGNGTAALPSLAFSSDQDTGLFRLASDQLAFTTAGVRAFFIGSDGSINMDAGHNINADDGTAAAPGYRFGADPNTGIYRNAADSMRLVAGGTVIATAVNTGTSAQFVVGSGTVTEPSLCIAGNQTHGFYRIPGLDVTGSTVPFAVSNGTAAEPSYAWANNLTMGLYRSATNQFSASILGAEVFRWDTNGVRVISGYHLEMGTNSQVHAADGTLALPAISFQNDPDTGIWRPNPNEIAFVTGGVEYLRITNEILANRTIRFDSGPSTSRIWANDGTFTNPSYSFHADVDTGIYRSASDTFRLVSGGNEKLVIEPTGVRMINGNQFSAGSAGGAATPAITFIGDTDTGVYLGGTNRVGIAGNGVQIALFDAADGGNALTLNQSFVGRFSAINANNTANNSAADVTIGMGVNDGNAGDPFLVFAIGGPTRYWTMGIDNSNSDRLNISTTSDGTAKPGTGDVFRMTTGGQLEFSNGSAAAPSIAFINDQDCGLFRSGTNEISLATNGNLSYRVHPTNHAFYISGVEVLDINSAGNFVPQVDNTRKLGQSGLRFSEVWAANGTIQTSHSSTKENIQELDWRELEVPAGVTYDRDGRKWLGYLNDSLPVEARPLDQDGNVSTKENYEQSVIGVLCAVVKGLKEEVAALKTKLGE